MVFGGHATLSNGLAAYFGFDEDASDSTGNYPTGTPVNSPDFVDGGVEINGTRVYFGSQFSYRHFYWDTPMVFDGGDDGEITVSFWARLPSWQNPSDGAILSSSTYSPSLRFDGTSIKVLTGPGGQASLSGVSEDQWEHVVVCYPGDNDTVGGYIVLNGNWAGRTTFDNLVKPDIERVGSTSPAGYYGFNGYFDELAIWNRKLTQSEVEDLYNSGTGLFYSDPGDPPEVEVEDVDEIYHKFTVSQEDVDNIYHKFTVPQEDIDNLYHKFTVGFKSLINIGHKFRVYISADKSQRLIYGDSKKLGE